MAYLSLRVLGANRTLLLVDDTEVFFSYNTPVAAFSPSTGYLVTNKTYSRTTTRHIREYLGDHVAVCVSPSRLTDLLTMNE